MKYWPHWCSHYPVLIKIMQITNGDVLELGMGMGSTPLLHWLCFDKGRNLVSYENNKEWFEMHKHFHKDWHEINFVEDWDKIEIEKQWSVALVDHSPARRRQLEIKRLAKYAKYVIVHDTQPEDNHFYKYHWAFPKYKYQWTYKKAKPWTTVLSNFVNVGGILK